MSDEAPKPVDAGKIDLKDRYQTLIDTRNMEIKLFWERSNYFLVLNTGIALGFFNITDPFYTAIFSGLGVVVSWLWFQVCLGGKFWQTRWEQRLMDFEAQHLPDLHFFAASDDRIRSDAERGLKLDRSNPIERPFYRLAFSMKPSVSLAMTRLSLIFLFIWTGLLFFSVQKRFLGPRAPSTAGGSPIGLSGSFDSVSDALNNIATSLRTTGNGVSVPATSLEAVPWLTMTVLVVFGGGGLLLAGLSNHRWLRCVGIGSAALALGGVTLFKIGEVTFKPDVQLRYSLPTSSLVCGHRVGPFVTGEASALESTDGQPARTPADIAKDLAIQAKGRQLLQLVLIGSADKFELLPALRARYGSNTGLARVRADWVQQELSREMERARIPPTTYLALTVGPAKHGQDLSSRDVGPDRSVSVCPVWRQKAGWLERLAQ